MAKDVDIPLHLYQVLEEEYLNLHGPLEEEDVVELPTTRAGVKTYRRVRARRDWLLHRGHIERPLSLILKLLSREERVRLGAATNGAPPVPESVPPAGSAATERPARNDLAERLRGSLTFDDLKQIHEALTPFVGQLDLLIDDVSVPELAPLQLGPSETAEEATERKALKAAQEALDKLKDGLNKMLLDEQEPLYTSERFMQVTLSDATKLLIQEGTTRMRDVNDAVKSLFAERVLYTGDDLVQFKRLLLEDIFPDEIEKVANVRLAAINVYLHSKGQAAVCLSGGGIRSGTFALGLIQGLARRNLLGQFQYLSTVSGGGYIGSWLTAWIHRHRDGLEGVTNDLRNTPPSTKVDPDPGPVRYLRRYSNFITPQVGLLTADTWTFVAIYLRNLFLNWTVLIPLLLGWLLLPRVYNSLLLARTPLAEGGTHHTLGWDLAGYQLEGRHLLLALGCVLAVMAIAYVAFNRPYIRELLRVRSPFWFKRTGQRSFLRWCMLPLTGAAVCVTIYWAWSREVHEAMHHAARGPWVYLTFGAGLCVTGWLAAMCVLRRLPWAAPVLGAVIALSYLSKEIDNLLSFALLGLFVLFALVEWLLVKRAHLVYARPGELSLFEGASLGLAGIVGGFSFWLGEYHIPSPVRRIITGDWTTWTTEFYTCLAVPVFFLGFLLSMTMFIGLTSHSQKFTDEDREWWARAGAWCLIVCIGWIVFSVLVIFGPLALLTLPKTLAAAGGASGLLSLLAGRSSKTPANDEKAAEGGGLLASVMGGILPLLAALFLAIFVALLALITSLIVAGICHAYGFGGWVVIHVAGGVPPLDAADLLQVLGHMWAVHYASYLLTLVLAAVLLVFGFIMARAINLNRFSLHAGYRDRLIRGFLGASRDESVRRPNPFTGFDPLDNVRMHELQPMLLQEGDFKNIAQLTEKLRLADPAWRKQNDATDISQYLWDKGVLRDDTKEELQDYSPDALPSQSLKELLIRDLNAAVEDLEYPLYAAEPFLPLRQKEPASGIIKWVREKTPVQLEQYRRSTHAILLNRVLLQLAYPDEIREKYPPPHRGMHIVNTTLNLVGGDNLAWQQRKAEPFSVSPLHSGCFRLGYRRSRSYGDEQGIKLGTAAAISGAAASSNMGYYTTSPVLSMVLTLFNVRLGWWLGNPGPAGKTTYSRQSPKYSVAPILAEAFGLTDDKSKYVYLTDGGHFENLALYEMVLRRCRLIILSDAAADEEYQFNDLGNAVRKIRIDLGVPIDFEEVPIFRGSLDGDEGGRRGGYWAVGRIKYSCVDKGAEDGVLIYVKPAVYGQEPQDVLHYKRSHNAFPHETTADQFFDEPQFESYRALGSYIMDRMCGDDASQVESVVALARRLYRQDWATDKWRWPTLEATWLTSPPQQQQPQQQPQP
ncbi:MAG: hypothetical protein ACJ74T_02690 [Pyrinomonadaceae bacterium]